MTQDLEFATKECADCVRYREWREPYPYGSTVVYQDCAECLQYGDLWAGSEPCPDFKEKPCR